MSNVSAKERLFVMLANCDTMPMELPTDEIELFYWFKGANLVAYSNSGVEKDFDSNGEVKMYYQNLCECIRDYVCEVKGFDDNVFSEAFWNWYAMMQTESKSFPDNVSKIKEYAKKCINLIYSIRVNRARVQFSAKEAHIDMMCAILEKDSASN